MSSKKTVKALALISLMVVLADCAPRKNASGRVGKGKGSRASGSSISALGAGGSVTPSNPSGIQNFFTNFMNSDGTQFKLPCGVSQIAITAKTDGVVSASQGILYSAVSSNGAQLHLDFLLSCTGRDSDGSTYNDVAIDIEAGKDGYIGAASSDNGNSISVTFQDEYGTITLSGTVSGQQFTGQLSYSNLYYFDQTGTQQTPGASDTIGNFSLPVCSVFTCYN